MSHLAGIGGGEAKDVGLLSIDVEALCVEVRGGGVVLCAERRDECIVFCVDIRGGGVLL
jgi:hypothetical protein